MLPAVDANEILAHARAAFHAVPRPAYVSYTLTRVEYSDGFLNLLDTYGLRIWCRTSDRAALTRSVYRGRAVGPMRFLRPAFNEPLDPGPPTADIFERAPLRFAPSPEPSATDDLKTIGTIQVRVEYDYQAELIDTADDAYHLRLIPRRDPERNLLREVWVDRRDFSLRRARAADTLFVDFQQLPLIDDIRFAQSDGMPVFTQILSRTVGDHFQPPKIDDESHYRYDDVQFPEKLPDWYFDPASYGMHAGEAPG